MTQLPDVFIQQTRQLMGTERFERYLQSFEEEPPVSIRLNPMKAGAMTVADGEQVPWCRTGYYLKSRPNFTMDPLLHAGCYYVQEAASMFLDEVLRQLHDAYVSHQPSDLYLPSTSVPHRAASRRCCVRHCRQTACSTVTNPCANGPTSCWRT